MTDTETTKAEQRTRFAYQVMVRTGFRCQDCGLGLEDHRKRYRKSLLIHRVDPTQPATVAGCVPLCVYCHRDRITARQEPDRRYVLRIELRFDHNNKGILTALRHMFRTGPANAVLSSVYRYYEAGFVPTLGEFRPRCVDWPVDPRSDRADVPPESSEPVATTPGPKPEREAEYLDTLSRSMGLPH